MTQQVVATPSVSSLRAPQALDAITRVGVVVPARDEEERIAACLDAIARAGARLHPSRPDIVVDVVVVLDRCVDGTEAVVRSVGLVPLTAEGGVGTARAAGAQHAIARARAAGVDDRALWLASTDADSEVPEHWLQVHVELAESGLDAVFGTVEPSGASPAVLAEWHRRHCLAEGHPYVHGANLGVRAATYRAAGGYPPLARDEDVTLVASIKATSPRWVATDRCRVASSGRLEARCVGGFADYLGALVREVG